MVREVFACSLFQLCLLVTLCAFIGKSVLGLFILKYTKNKDILDRYHRHLGLKAAVQLEKDDDLA